MIEIKHFYIIEHDAKHCIGIIVIKDGVTTVLELGQRLLSNFFPLRDGESISDLRTASRDIQFEVRSARTEHRAPDPVDRTPWLLTIDTDPIQIEDGGEWNYFKEVVLKGNNIADFNQAVEYET